MNIDSAKLSSFLPGHAVAEEASPSLAANGAMPDGFADALMKQIETLIESGGRAELPKPPQNAGESESNNANIAGLPLEKEHAQELAALLGKDLPMAPEININEDLEATLVALNEALKYMANGEVAQDMAAPEPGAEEIAKPEDKIEDATVQADRNGVVAAMVPKEVAAQMRVESASENKLNDQLGDVLVSDALLATAEGIPVAMLSVQEKTANDLTQVAASQEKAIPAFIKATSEAGQSNVSGEDASAVDFSQQEAAAGQLIPHEQNDDLNPFGKADRTEKPAPSEGQFSPIEGDKALPRVAADLKQVMDNKVDMPAITKPITHPDWHKDLGERIVWMNNKTIPAAEIKLNPQQLGPISVRIDVNQDQASVVFTAQHAAVRDALEAAIPKLRDMMSAQQLNLVDVNVAQNFSSGQGQSHRFTPTLDGWPNGAGSVAADVAEEVANGRAVASNGLLSLYA